MSKNRPLQEFRLGRVKCLVWGNETESGVMHNVTFQRLYKDGDDPKSLRRGSD